MATTTLGPTTVHTHGELPAVGSTAPDFTLVTADLKEIHLRDFAGKRVVLNIFPSVDTSVCATSVRVFNQRAAGLSNTVVVCVSKDLPFAIKRFCAAEGIDQVITASDFRNLGFSAGYGTELTDSAFAGLHARAVVVIDEKGKVIHTELVPAIGQEPDYEAALRVL